MLSDFLQRWTETYVKWSPRGTYLATFHAKGIALWGGDNFGQITRFSHAGVQLIEFSPCERYGRNCELCSLNMTTILATMIYICKHDSRISPEN